MRQNEKSCSIPKAFAAALATPPPAPCIVEAHGATCVITQGAQASLDDAGNILLQLVGELMTTASAVRRGRAESPSKAGAC